MILDLSEGSPEGELPFGLPSRSSCCCSSWARLAGLLPVLVASSRRGRARAHRPGRQAVDLSSSRNMISGWASRRLDYSLFSCPVRESGAGRENGGIAIVGSPQPCVSSSSRRSCSRWWDGLVPDTILRSSPRCVLVGIVTVVARDAAARAPRALGDRGHALRVPARSADRASAGIGAESGHGCNGMMAPAAARGPVSAGLLCWLRYRAGLETVDRFGSAGPLCSEAGFLLLELEFARHRRRGRGGRRRAVRSRPSGGTERRSRIEADAVFSPRSRERRRSLAPSIALVAGDSRDQRSLASVQRLRSDVVPTYRPTARAPSSRARPLSDRLPRVADSAPIVFALCSSSACLLTPRSLGRASSSGNRPNLSRSAQPTA